MIRPGQFGVGPALLCAAALCGGAPCAVCGMDQRPAAPANGDLTNTAAERLRVWPVVRFRAAVEAELAERSATDEQRAAIERLWQAVPDGADGDALLAAAVQIAAALDPRSAELQTLLSQLGAASPLTDDAWLTGETPQTFLIRQQRLAYGRWLAQRQYYDDALRLLHDVGADDVAHPAALLFFQAVCHQRLAQREPGLTAVSTLLESVDNCPQRYRAVAELMQRDLEQLKDESLDHISRKMDHVRRRLSLGQSVPPTRQVEDEVLQALDKLIHQLEEQQKQQQQAQAAGAQGRGSNTPGGKPAEDSRIMGGRGAGETTPRDIGSRGGWGDLPARDRHEALQQIGRDFPPHYRDIVEQYFRRLANQAEETEAAASP